MSLIKSISGIRGTIGGKAGFALTPMDIAAFSSAFGQMILQNTPGGQEAKRKIVVGRDSRTSGPMVQALVINTLLMMGLDVTDLGLATTPTVEMAVIKFKADGGIIITASHNPGNWNALKLLNSSGEFFSAKDGEKLLELTEKSEFVYATANRIGEVHSEDFLGDHISAILDLPAVNTEGIRAAGFKIVVDAVNSVGGFAIPSLLESLGVKEIICLNCEPDGEFAHNPEPLPENLTGISELVKESGADLGIVVDPDVDRLALVCEDGSMFGEEYTLVAIADYILGLKPGNTVSNMSSSQALRDVTLKYGGEYHSSAVGEVNVVEKMKEVKAVIGGEGNGGVIYPDLHYGRDALVGTALFLSHLANQGIKMSQLRLKYPSYVMLKQKLDLEYVNQADIIIESLAGLYKDQNPDLRDGLKLNFPSAWVHLRKSNTEPIIRIYSEAATIDECEHHSREILKEITRIRQLYT